MKPRPSPWWWIIVLYSPVIAFYAAHYAVAFTHPGLTPTGFVQYDVAYTMACAREFADNGLHGLLFTLPSNAREVDEPVLLQLHMWALGQIWRVCPLDPGTLYVLFAAVMGLLAVRVFTRLFDALVPATPSVRRWGHVLFLWGGGLLALAGEAVNIMQGRPVADTWKHVLDVDPAYGWWMMNLGRCLILPNEAYYHLLFYAAALAFIRERHAMAVACLLVLAASHPFAGMGGLLVFLTWSAVERLVLKDRNTPLPVPIMLASAFVACCWYYFIWLPPRLDPHLTTALNVRYLLELRATVLGYLLVGMLAWCRLRTVERLRAFLRDRASRMLVAMVVVQLALENHELVTATHQPVHFTRGYTWAALFLIGAPWLLNEAWPWVREQWPRARAVIAASLVLLFLTDNAVFFTLNIKRELRASSPGFWLTTEQREVLAFLNARPPDGSLVIGQDEDLAYMVIVYTPWRAYRSHYFDEDDAWSRVKQQAAYFDGKITDPLLEGPLMVIAINDGRAFMPPGASELVFSNAGYRVFRAE
jgi:hypothetical protein